MVESGDQFGDFQQGSGQFMADFGQPLRRSEYPQLGEHRAHTFVKVRYLPGICGEQEQRASHRLGESGSGGDHLSSFPSVRVLIAYAPR